MRNILNFSLAFAVGICSLSAFNANAVSMSQPNYTHASANYLNSNRSRSGLFLESEYELDHKVFVFGHYKNASFRQGSGGDYRESLLDLGAGKYFTIADGVTMDFSASVGRIADSGNLFATGQNFYTLNTSFRNRFEVFETRVGYRYINFDDSPSDSGIVASGWWYFSPQFSFGVTFQEVYSGSTWGFGARFSF